MCPACIANLALTAAAGVTTTGGLTALIATTIRRKKSATKAAFDTKPEEKSS